MKTEDDALAPLQREKKKALLEEIRKHRETLRVPFLTDEWLNAAKCEGRE